MGLCDRDSEGIKSLKVYVRLQPPATYVVGDRMGSVEGGDRQRKAQPKAQVPFRVGWARRDLNCVGTPHAQTNTLPCYSTSKHIPPKSLSIVDSLVSLIYRT